MTAEILIVGGGLFGLTTALALAEGPYASQPSKILIIGESRFYRIASALRILTKRADRSANPPELDAASSDINKITRGGDYSNKIYSDLGAQSLKRWQEDPFWKPHFHQSGIVIGSPIDNAAGKAAVETSFNNLLNLHENGVTPTVPTMLGSDAAYLSAMKVSSADLVGVKPGIAYYNDQSGWSAARDSMVAVVAKLRHLGVRFEAGLVQRLLVENGDVRGVQCTDGREFRAGKLTVLAAGSWTCAVLPELKQRLTATGQVLATIQLSPEEAALYANAPVYLSFNRFFYVFPPNKDGLVKCAEHARGYTNEQPSLANPKETVSVPRTGHFGGSLHENVPKPAIDELREELQKVWPKLAEKPFASTRMCWYCDTADEDWLIGYHDAYPSLFVATGGSGHAFKFAPIMGELCLAGIESRLPTELEDTWSFSEVRECHPRPAETVIQGKLDISEFASTEDLLPK